MLILAGAPAVPRARPFHQKMAILMLPPIVLAQRRHARATAPWCWLATA